MWDFGLEYPWWSDCGNGDLSSFSCVIANVLQINYTVWTRTAKMLDSHTPAANDAGAKQVT